MRKIINGKLYDTGTAKEVGDWSELYPGDFHYVSETLYVKRTGEFFIHGEGGAMTRYRECCGDLWLSGEAIVPLTKEEAQEWVEQHLDADTYIDLFGEVAE